MSLAANASLGPSASSAPLVPVSALLAGASPEAATPIWVDDRFAHSFLEENQLVPGAQTRPNLKIQEGCGNRCTFCIIPETRGHSRSLSAQSVLGQVRNFVAAGGNELVLSGINLGRWGRDLPAVETASPSRSRLSLASLVRRILDETDLPRLRLSSIEPMDWDADLLAVVRDFAGSRLAPHAHLPLQSGSDAVLRRMHRRYRPWHYVEKATSLLDAAGPDLTLGADVMVGFPGETDAEFEQTCQLIRDLPFGYLHLFPFSPRPGTAAWALHRVSPVPPQVVDERMAFLITLGCDKAASHRRRFLGRTLDAITLHTRPALRERGRTAALTHNFIPLELEGIFPANQLLLVKGTGLTADRTLTAHPAP
jgi:threonylcarbamoyladenosine tRNA methylthiotransferase MtaB